MKTTETITPGMGATINLWSDRHAATIITATATKITVQEDTAKRTDGNGLSEAQEYAYTRNPQGSIATFTLRRNGRFVQKGEPMRTGRSLTIGVRRSYRDPSF